MLSSNLLGRVRKGLNGCGVDLRRYPISFDPDHIRNDLLRRLGISLVLDVGANVGQYGALIRYHGYRGRIVSFEPVRTAFAQLVSRCKDSAGAWQARYEALGEAEGTAKINIADTMSSLLPKSSTASDAVRFSSATVEEVPVRTLDGM